MPHDHSLIKKYSLKPKRIGITVLALVVIGIGLTMALRFTDADLDQSISRWQEKLNMLADSHSIQVTQWVEAQFAEMEKLADNPALHAYMQSRLSPVAGENAEKKATTQQAETVTESVPQETLAKNILSYAAERLGFVPTELPESLEVPDDVAFSSASGIALLDSQYQIVLSTEYFNELEPQVKSSLERNPSGMRGLIDMYRSQAGSVVLGFVQPVLTPGQEGGQPVPIGRLVAIKALPDRSFSKLFQPPITERGTLSILLVRAESGNVVTLVPGKGDGSMLTTQGTNDPETLAGASVIASPGALIEKPDARGVPILATGRPIPGTPWTLMVRVDRDEALQESALRRKSLAALIVASALLVAITLLAVWYIASAKRSRRASEFFRDMAEAASHQQQRLGQLVGLLVHLVDRRDPSAARHSQQVSRLALYIGGKMDLSVEQLEVLRLAGLLMNIGKIVVPEDVLTKSGPLDADEKHTVRQGLRASASLIEEVASESEIAATIRQSREWMDGTGPEGRKSENILLTARILAVVNVFISLISPRAYRDALAPANAIDTLKKGAGSQYDPQVVQALNDILENAPGKAFLEECLGEPLQHTTGNLTLVKQRRPRGA